MPTLFIRREGNTGGCDYRDLGVEGDVLVRGRRFRLRLQSLPASRFVLHPALERRIQPDDAPSKTARETSRAGCSSSR